MPEEITTYLHCGATFVTDGALVYVTRFGVTYTMTAEAARAAWCQLSAERRSYDRTPDVAAGRRSLRGW